MLSSPVTAQAKADEVDAPTAGATVLAGGDLTSGRLALVEIVERPGQSLPRHAHHWEDESLYVLAGAIALWQEGSWRELAAGQVGFVPRSVEHAVVALTPEARLLSTLTPAGFEGFYREQRGLAPGSLPLDRLVALAARYGCEITGTLPPLPGELKGRG